MKNLKKIIFAIFILTVLLLPVLSFAQINTTNYTPVEEECNISVQNVGDVICRIGFFLNQIIPILLALGVIYFIWGVVQYMIKDDEEAKKKGKSKIIYGIIGLVIIVGLWGLITLVIETFNLDQQQIAIINPANIIDNNVQTNKTDSCFNTYQASGRPKLGDLINYATCVVGASVIPLLFILAVASFIWGVVQYVINDQEEAKKAKGRQFMIWGIIALAVMVSIWGLVRIFTNTFDINFTVPQVHTQ